jgi:hypothetical protein
MSITANSDTGYLTCIVDFNPAGVVLKFEPEVKPNAKRHHTKQEYEAIVGPLRPVAPGQASGAAPQLPNGTFKRREHVREVAKNKPTKMAFLVDPLSSWRFTNKGFAPKAAAAQALFSPIVVAPSGKVVEVTFTPNSSSDAEYFYELWLEANVVDQQGVAVADASSVTIIIDPVVKSTTIPP